MDDQGASPLHIPLKSKQGTLYTRDGRGNKEERNKGGRAEKKRKEKYNKRRSCGSKRDQGLEVAERSKK